MLLILGGGALGTLFAVNASMKTQVCVLVRNKLAYSQGLQILNDSRKEFAHPITLITANELNQHEFKVALFACKHYDLHEMSRLLVHHHCCSIPLGVTLSNGLDPAHQVLPQPFGQVLGAVTYTAAKVLSPGLIQRTSAADAPTFMPPPTDPLLEEWLLQVIPFLVVTRNIEREVWKKLLANCVINPLSAIFNVRNGEVPTLAGPILVHLIQEFLSVCPVEGMDDVHACEAHIRKVCANTFENTSSMRADLLSHRKTEIDSLNGALLTRKKTLPVNETIVSIIKGLEIKGSR